MKYSIVYSSKTGNTKMLADTIRETLPSEDCVYFGEVNEIALQADRLYIGSWTDKGRCSDEMVEFLGKLDHQQVFIFGTAGFGGGQSYFDQILSRIQKLIPEQVEVIGTYMCQGKMPMSVRNRYEKMAENPKMKMMIENFDQALSHPDQADLDALKKKLEVE